MCLLPCALFSPVTSERSAMLWHQKEIHHVVTSDRYTMLWRQRERSAMLWRQTFFYSLHCSYTKRCHSLSEIVHVHVHLQVANKTKDDYTRRLVLWGKIEQPPSIIYTSSFRPHSWLAVDSVDVCHFCRRHLASCIHSLLRMLVVIREKLQSWPISGLCFPSHPCLHVCMKIIRHRGLGHNPVHTK